MAIKPGVLCTLQKDKLIDSQEGFVDTFNWIVASVNNLKGGQNCEVNWVAPDTPQIDAEATESEGGDGGGGGGGETVDVITDISFNFDSATHQLTATLTKKRLTVIDEADISGVESTATLPLYESDVVVGSDYNESVQHAFNNFTRKGVVTGSDSQPTSNTVFTSTPHSNE